MKHLVLSLGVLLLSLPGHAQFTRTYTGALLATDPAIPGDRLFRDGTTAACGPTKTFPGTSSGAGVHYDTYTVGNSTATATCVTVTLAPACTESTTAALLFAAAYRGSFVPTNLATNYLTDMGTSPIGPTTTAMGVTLAPGQVLVVVISGLTAAGTCSSYGLTVAAPVALPVRASLNTDAPALAAYPNPVQDVLHIATDKAGSYTLYNAIGAVVKRAAGREIVVGDLPGGVYLLQHDETKATTRIVKQ